VNEEALAHWGLMCQKKKKIIRISGEKYIQEMFKNRSTPNSNSLCVKIVHIICIIHKRISRKDRVQKYTHKV
jgi:hypothetical protein